MLSKSQALLFFLVATVGFSGVFLWLTVDTIRQVPARSNEAAMSTQVVQGKEIWEANNCMGCHTLLGEGGYYAPELTKVVERRGEAWMRVFLRDPEAMFPGQRRMPQYNFTEEEIDAVIAFFAWIGGIDTNGFPPDPDLAPVLAKTTGGPPSEQGDRPDIFDQICVACHSLGGAGGAVGPALDAVGDRYTNEELRLWLANPTEVKPGTAMPNLGLTDPQLDALTEFLMAQRGAR